MADQRGNRSPRIRHGLGQGSRAPPQPADQGRLADTCQRPARRPCPPRLGHGLRPATSQPSPMRTLRSVPRSIGTVPRTRSGSRIRGL